MSQTRGQKRFRISEMQAALIGMN